MLNPTINLQVGDFNNFPILFNNDKRISILVEECVNISKEDWDTNETSWNFSKHPFVNIGLNLKNCNQSNVLLKDIFNEWRRITTNRYNLVKSNEEELNKIFIALYKLESEVTGEISDDDITISKANLGRDIKSFISYSVGCMFGRYSIDVDGLVFAGNSWDQNNYKTFIPDKDNVLPITDEEYFQDDIVGLLVQFIKNLFGEKYLEDNLNFIAKGLGNTAQNSRETIRNYFTKEFYKDHCSAYSVSGSGKRPIYWLFDSGKQNGFKALIYMHRYDENTIGNLRIDYLQRMQRIYENEIGRMQDAIENSDDAREVTAATKRKEKLIKQLQETKEYDEKIAHLALARTSIDLDDGVKVNYEKVQTDRDGKKLDVLAKI